MTYLFNNQVDFVPRALDSASRVRVSNPLTLFEHNNQYGTSPFKWDTLFVGTGSLTDNANASTTLSTGGGLINAQATRASRMYLHYQVGKSFYMGMSFTFGAGVTNVSKRVGFFDANNGVYLEQNGAALNLVVRTNASGSVVNTSVPQASWNVDQLNGSGPSGMTFNPLGSNDFRFDFVGTFAIRFYVYYNGVFWLFHTIENASVTSPTVPTPATTNLTIRQEIVNLAAVGGATTMTVYNANVMSEGSEEQVPVYTFSVGNGITTKAVTTRRPICSIRADTTGPGRSIRNYGQIIPYTVDPYADTNSIYWEVVTNGTLTGASFAAVSPVGLADLDTSATAITGGTTILSGYVGVTTGGPGVTGRVSVISDLDVFFPLVYSSLANVQDTITLVATSFTGTANVAGSFGWVEYY